MTLAIMSTLTITGRCETNETPSAPARSAFFTWPRMPLTVRTAAPSKRATSTAEVNMPFRKAVFLNTRYG